MKNDNSATRFFNYAQNVNLSTIKELMGHENIQTTMIYARSDEESMIRAVTQL